MRRLYVGGLSHSVTEKDLRDRFGKFGDVKDVELRTRRDDEGVPYKTFGYININISDTDLRKCLTVLNKSKWKGGTLQIETAKESFLHRLAQERQVAAGQLLQQPAAEDKRQKLLESLSNAGVENFTMKAAVPGTEVPGHKDWVVSKFGRVLPVLQLRCQKGSRARTVKYDPSKYSHNIRKLDRTTADQSTPVTQLTWEVQGGDDDISKKRRGEFPPYEPPRPKKSRTQIVNSQNPVNRVRFEQTLHTETRQLTNGFESPANRRPTQRTGAYFNDSDVDSDEEIRWLVATQQTSHSGLQQEFQDDNLEVVGFDYLVKSGQKGRPDDEDEDDCDSADTDELFASRKPQEDKTPQTAHQLSGNNADRKRKTKKKSKVREEGDDESDDEHLTLRKLSSEQRSGSGKQNSQKKCSHSENQTKNTTVPSSQSDSDEENEDDGELESADSCSDSDYEAMFSNVVRLEISLGDLQRLAEESQQTSETTTPRILSTGAKKGTNLIVHTAQRPVPKKGTLPEDILAAIMEEDSSDDEHKEKKKKTKRIMSTPLPAFQGTRVLNERSETGEEEEDGGRSVIRKQKLDSDSSLKYRATGGNTVKSAHTESEKTSESSEEEEEEEDEEDKEEEDAEIVTVTKVLKSVPNDVPVNSKKAETGSSTSSDDEDGEEEEQRNERMKTCETDPKAEAAPKTSPSTYSLSDEEDEDNQGITSAAPLPAPDSDSSSSEEQEEEAPHPVPLKAGDEEERQREANLRRLAAVQQRQKEAEEHKRLIHGALANLDAPKAGAGKHIVFGSDDEEDEDEQQTTSDSPTRKALFQESQSEDESTDDIEVSDSKKSTTNDTGCPKPAGPQLFGDSEEEDDGDEEENGGRFDIKPQYEGRAGQKLMELQSRFGTDERFRMDSRFLEEDKKEEEESETKRSVTEEDEALEQERKKNLEILHSILGSSQQTCSKTASRAKTFRDVSALHYDPSKEEHAAFETKSDEMKESKSARRKKREEAQKLPEVSKEIYYDVAGDLKAVFGPTKNNDAADGEEKTSWDQEEAEDVGGKDDEPTLLSPLLTTDPNAEKESTGFKFSFFGDDTETESKETAEYQVESIQAPKVSWQQDPRFNDSSSEEEEEEQEEAEEKTSAATKTTEEETRLKMDLFFFYPDDSRLTEGPRLFCRSSQLEEQREQWEERRNALRQEYRKKHKDARRKMKASQKS